MLKLKSTPVSAQGCLPPLLLALAVVLSFRPVFSGEFVWDDRIVLIGNPHYRGLDLSNIKWMFTTFMDGNYHPLSWLTFGLDYCLWGMNPAGYHLTSVLLHVANVLLLYHVLKILLTIRQTRGRSDRAVALTLAAFTGALFYGIHPLRVETVAWVSARGDLVCCFFYLLTIGAYCQYAGSGELAGRRRTLYSAYLFFILSLLGRAWGITLPVVLLILDVYPLQRLGGTAGIPGRVLKEKIPFGLLALAAAWLAIEAKMAGNQMAPIQSHGIMDRLAQAMYGLSFYPVKSLLPVDLSPLYLLEKEFDPVRFRYISSLLAVITATVILVVRRRRWPWGLTTWLIYMVIISPQLGLVQSGPQVVADRYSYIAALPFAVLVGASVMKLLSNRFSENLIHLVGLGIICVLLLLGVISHVQSNVWRDRFTLWQHVISLNPNNDIAYYNLGVYYLNRGQLERAVESLTASSRLSPEKSPPYNNLGVAYMMKGDGRRALQHFNRALALNRNYPEAYANRGLLRYKSGDIAGAVQDCVTALTLTETFWRYRGKVEALLQKARTGGGHKSADYPEGPLSPRITSGIIAEK